MYKIKRKLLMILTFGIAIVISSTALAHKVNIFAYVDNGVVYTESYFPDGSVITSYSIHYTKLYETCWFKLQDATL